QIIQALATSDQLHHRLLLLVVHAGEFLFEGIHIDAGLVAAASVTAGGIRELMKEIRPRLGGIECAIIDTVPEVVPRVGETPDRFRKIVIAVSPSRRERPGDQPRDQRRRQTGHEWRECAPPAPPPPPPPPPSPRAFPPPPRPPDLAV